MSTKARKPKRKIMRSLKLMEISAVDTPAQEGARMVLMKRHDGVAKTMGLADVFTTSNDGHQHGVEISTFEGEPHIWITRASGPEGESHSHAVMRDSDGNLVLAENEGHTHELDADMVTRALMTAMIGKSSDDADKVDLNSTVSVAALIAGTREPALTGKSADNLGKQPTGDDVMAEKNADALSADLKKRDEEIALLKAVIDLTPEHRAHYETLSGDKDRRIFALEKGHAARDADIEAAQKSDPVIYTAGDGTEYRKSDDPRLIKMAKERDEDREEMVKIRTEAEQAGFEKKAQDVLGLIPGEKVEKIALVRAVTKIEDEETRDKAFELLVAANKVYNLAMGTLGAVDTVAPVNAGVAKAADLLDQAIETCAKEDKISKAKATDKVLGTVEGQRLYDASRIERIASGRSRVDN